MKLLQQTDVSLLFVRSQSTMELYRQSRSDTERATSRVVSSELAETPSLASGCWDWGDGVGPQMDEPIYSVAVSCDVDLGVEMGTCKEIIGEV